MAPLRVGKLFGIELRVDVSWLVIALLMTLQLTGIFAYWHPAWPRAITMAAAGSAAAIFFASIALHELAHAMAARAYGIRVRDITFFLFGGISNIEREPPSPLAELVIAVVGPLASFAIGIAATALGVLLTGVDARTSDPATLTRGLGPMATVLLWVGPANLTLAAFNLLPAFPLDGGRMLRAALWAATGRVHTATRWASGIGHGFGWLMVAAGISMALGVSLPLVGGGLGGGVWLALLGWFLRSASLDTYRATVLQDLLEGVRVADIMRRHGFVYLRGGGRERTPWLASSDDVALDPDQPLADALERLARSDLGEMPVARGGELVGLLVTDDVVRYVEWRRRHGAREAVVHR